MSKIITIEEALSKIESGMRIMVSGFMANGAPDSLMAALAASNKGDFTLISSDTGTEETGCGRLIAAKKVKKLYASHIGLNKETGRQMNEGTLDVELVPQGTFAERVRCAGAGLGGVLTPTGVGTIVEEGKQKIEIDGQVYLLELPLHADIALIRGSIVDEMGNVYYNKTTRNFNPLMAMAAKITIVEAEKIVPVGTILPENVVTPFNFVKFIVQETAHV